MSEALGVTRQTLNNVIHGKSEFNPLMAIHTTVVGIYKIRGPRDQEGHAFRRAD